MDDSEYYKKMREQYSHTKNSVKVNKNFQYTQWASHQGREDAQMLSEKSIGWNAKDSEDKQEQDN